MRKISRVEVGAKAQNGRKAGPVNLYLNYADCDAAEQNAEKRYGLSLSGLVGELLKLENASKRGLLAGRISRKAKGGV
jgi:hypothetical protein